MQKIENTTLITVAYNSAHCVPVLALLLQEFEHVFLVDNGSDDDTIECAEALVPHAKLICNNNNLGFGAANNLALNHVTTPYALLLNPDCITSVEPIKELIAVAQQNPDAAIVAPHLLRRDGAVEVNYRWPHDGSKLNGRSAEGICCVGFVCGAVMLFNMKVMREIGFFDERFFLYYEDDDLCRRVFAQKREILLVPEISVRHYSRGSVKGKRPLKSEFERGYHHAQSKIIFEFKYVGEERASALRRKTLILALLTLPLRLLIPQPRYVARLFGRIFGLISEIRYV